MNYNVEFPIVLWKRNSLHPSQLVASSPPPLPPSHTARFFYVFSDWLDIPPHIARCIAPCNELRSHTLENMFIYTTYPIHRIDPVIMFCSAGGKTKTTFFSHKTKTLPTVRENNVEKIRLMGWIGQGRGESIEGCVQEVGGVLIGQGRGECIEGCLQEVGGVLKMLLLLGTNNLLK